MLNRIAILIAFCVLAACSSPGTGDELTADSQEAALSGGMTTISGLLDEQSASSGFTRRTPLILPEFFSLLPRAWADTCTRAISQTCVSGTKSVTYSSCTGSAGRLTYNGDVQLSWNGDNDCVLEDGETVTRTADVTLSVRNASLAISSVNATNYLGDTLGGGGSLNQTSSNTWLLSVAGHHKVLSSLGREVYDVSVATSTPIGISGILARAGRTVNGGSLQVHHNNARFTATYQPVQVTYTALSCYPQSGSLNVTYTGTVTGTATVTFLGGGAARINKNGVVSEIAL
ncbi:MAG: hypothetical protein NDI61_07650, partial [Bdellovibrionaceae bacterium]|nr:hypothetical protein [Pseudobdellovibrionaceae bacterium]